MKKDKMVSKRIRGALIGFAIGDAMGATTEFMTKAEIQQRFGLVDDILGGGWLGLNPGQVTDDTQMMVCVARALQSTIDDGGGVFKFKRECADNFVDWYDSKPLDVGSRCATSISGYKATGELCGYSPDALGNGALMRFVPCALLGLHTWNAQQAVVTHNNEVQTRAVESLSKSLFGLVIGSEPLRYTRALQNPSGYVLNTYGNAKYWAARSGDFESAVMGAVNDGGDADTIAAITGALAGARFGFDAIPRRWVEKLDYGVFVELVKFGSFAVSYLQANGMVL